jgi:hypothetical protein
VRICHEYHCVSASFTPPQIEYSRSLNKDRKNWSITFTLGENFDDLTAIKVSITRQQNQEHAGFADRQKKAARRPPQENNITART